MKIILIIILIFSFHLLLNNKVIAQGCSDAGACSVGSFKTLYSGSSQEKVEDIYSTGITFGLGDDKVKILTPFIEYSKRVLSEFAISGKLTYGYASGTLGSVNNFGDLFITGDYDFKLIDNVNSSITVGAKIPLNQADESTNGLSYPMVYQSSVASYDIILGISSDWNSFSFGLGFQYPVAFVNNNNYPYSPLIDPKPGTVFTNKLKRSADVLMRFVYHYHLFDGFLTFSPGLLPIYHITNDSYSSFDNSKEYEIENSKGLTLNGTLSVNLRLNQNNNLIFSFGSPFITRKIFPDGLKRSFVAGLEFKGSI